MVCRWVSIIVTSLFVGGCTCERPSEEALLRERIDTLNVHLYLASKIAILKSEQSAEAKSARDALVSALGALEGRSTADASANAAPKLSATDALKLVKALYELRQEGKALLDSGNEQGLRPFLPVLFDVGNTPIAAVLDLNLEHALLMTGLLMLKSHPRSPVPIPSEIVLYEAHMTDPGRLLPGLRGLAHAEKAVIYGTSEFCILAAKEAKGADNEAAAHEQLGLALKTTCDANLTSTELRQAFAGLQALAHGATAYCLVERGERDSAMDELDRTLKPLESAGLQSTELFLFRAYVSNYHGDHAAVRKHIEAARAWPETDPQTRADLEQLLGKLEADPNVFQAKYGAAWFHFTLIKLVARKLDEAGVFDDLRRMKLAQDIARFGKAVSSTSEEAKQVLSGGGVVDRVKLLLRW